MHPPRLQQAHDSNHVQALDRSQQVRRIGHGVNQFRSRRVPDDAIFEQPNRARRMRLLGHHKRNQRQPHSHKHNFPVADLPRRRRRP